MPDAPTPKADSHPAAPAARPCPARPSAVKPGAVEATPSASATGFPGSLPPKPGSDTTLAANLCPPIHKNWYVRFADGPQDKPLTPPDKAWLAFRNLADPFNVITILADSGIAVASDSHSAYGPGWPGFGRNVGVSFTQDMTGEFFGTFLIPSVVHQDPHYHRMPDAKIARRFAHAILQVVWTQGDNGKPMLNYANLIGFAIDDEISNLYVPGRETNMSASEERYGIELASAPIGNFVSEFLPDVANHIHVQVVIIQRIINQVAKNGTAEAP